MRIKFNNEHIEFLEKNKKNTNKDLIEMFYQKFKIQLTDNKLTNARHRYNLQSGLIGGQFQKGIIPHNKGKKVTDYLNSETIEKIKKTQFKKGNHSFNNADHNKRNVLDERITKDGYIEIKIKEPNKWELKHRWIYEKSNGKIPKGYIVSFADGNRTNFDLDNLILIKKSENLIMNKQGLYYKDTELTKSGLLVAKIINKIREKEYGNNR